MTRVYSELVQVERAALRRGPRTRNGLRGAGLGAAEGLGEAIVAFWAIGTVATSLVVGLGFGIAQHSVKTGAIAAGVTAGISIAGAAGWSGYQRLQQAAFSDRQRDAGASALAQLQSFPRAAISQDATCAGGYRIIGNCYTCPSGTTLQNASPTPHFWDMRCAPAGWTPPVVT
jgi:hypothetical protein